MILVIIVIVVFFPSFNPFRQKMVLHAEFAHVRGLKNGAPVLLDGVNVGTVKNTFFSPDGEESVIVRISIDDQVHIPERSVAEIIELEKLKKGKALMIHSRGSSVYLQPGDTLMTLYNLKNKAGDAKDFLDDLDLSGSYVQDTVYKIQLFISQNLLNDKHKAFRGIGNVEHYFQNGYYKYTYGSFTSIDTALFKLKMIRELGFKDAFIVKFANEARILR